MKTYRSEVTVVVALLASSKKKGSITPRRLIAHQTVLTMKLTLMQFRGVLAVFDYSFGVLQSVFEQIDLD